LSKVSRAVSRKSSGSKLRRSTPVAATASKVTGTVSYPEPIALPSATTIRAQLVEVSRADAPADVVRERLIEAAGCCR
jgi:uncharacterized lipoprotein YbaY